MKIDSTTTLLAQAEQPVTEADDLGEILAEEIQGEVAVQPDPAEPGMPQLNPNDFAPQLVWLAITFVALYFLMARVALPRIATVIESRRDRIASDLDSAARHRQETDEVIAAYEQELAQARSKAHQIAANARGKLNDELAEERSRIEAETAETTAAAEERISKSRNQALGEVDAAARDVAADIVNRLIGTKPTAKELTEAVDAAKVA